MQAAQGEQSYRADLCQVQSLGNSRSVSTAVSARQSHNQLRPRETFMMVYFNPSVGALTSQWSAAVVPSPLSPM